MRYKVLVTGKNDSVITAFFEQMADDFVVLSSSTRFEDIVGHIDYFEPDIFAYCLFNEARDSIVQMLSISSRLMRSDIPCVIIGSKEDCDEFGRIAVGVANLILHRPITAADIQEKILTFMKGRAKADAADVIGAPITSSVDDILASLPGSSVPPAHGINIQPGADNAENPLRKKHILVVDDNPMMLKLIKEHLHEKYDVATAVSGKVALKFLERKTTDLILLDYLMPQENGPAVLEKLRAKDATKNIPVIFLTGVTERKKIREALILKPQGYLLKPVDRDKLLEEIAKIIG